MSTKSDHIDLNSDAVLFERENGVHGVNVLEPTPSDGVSVTETLTDPLSGQDQVPEPARDKDRDSQESACLAQFISGSNFGGFGENMKSEAVDGVETRMESGDRGIDVETEVGSVDKGIDVKACSFNVNGESLVGGEIEPNAERHGKGVLMRDEKELVAVQVVETVYSKLEKTPFEESKEETYVTVNPSSTFAYALQSEIGGDLGSLPSDVEPYCLVANTDESVSCKDLPVCSHVSKDENLDGLAMEINLEVENQMGLNISEAGISQNAGNLCSEFKLVDLEPYVSRDENVSGDVSVKSAASKLEFCVSDLVWGKVRSHPWWPGQIVDPSASSEKAKKYFKKESYLIAYFGDHTFAWNEASRIKPFRAHFSQMEKQSSSEDFLYAIYCALEEVSRRVEFGLACPSISKEVYDKVKTQIIINAGIREESSRKDGGDSFSSAASFEPVKLVGYVKTLARLPCYGGLNRLKFVTSQAQLLAFHRWRGYSQLPEFQMLGGLLENEAEISLLGEVKNCCEVTENAIADLKVDEQVPSGKGKSTSQDSSSHKRKHSSGDSFIPRKKEKSLSDLIAERRLSNSKSGLGNKVAGKKRKADESISDDSLVKHGESLLSTGDANKSPQFKQAFRVGASILRVASQLNGSSPLLKNGGDSSQEIAVKNKRKEKSQSKILFPMESSSLNEMLSQLCLAARNPMKKYGFLMSIVSFFSEFRNSLSPDQPSSGEHEQSPEQVSGGKIVEKPTNEPQSIVQQNINLDSELQPAGGNPKLEAIQPVGYSNRSCNEDLCKGDTSPTALILNFTDFDSVPSEANLNKIFSHYGHVIESQTEVLKKSSRARVVFRRRADAEVAFSSAGKYSTFGPSLVSYCLRYMPSTLNKASPNATKRSKKDVASVDGNAT